ncbi:tRNA (adenosine(37)-N6)-threonylcarbamoyltransferase complex dimerization subunit type 1 TsaB [Nocardioides plantarum]|uniref:tRNA (Adenosine(37)-N6)-threonylcarbamoyltransferase complex dimerization subunit type 1 TsaB n=1 Tax=Nocardioides plantarum TaxID=29299 RepID=A0ABV5KDG5_9ACTN|nr:tRNA (adenosine(37)-N6)-threonylcarbamoyltransferase complex dimerization subunit type 1 TsaB [Nocardioides plantarum]
MLLAFDTASPQVTVALLDDVGDVLAELVSAETMRHGEQLAPLIERVLAEAGATRLDVTAIAVGAGPGPFTGLRVGLVTARTLGFVLDVPVYGVCSLDALALEAAETGAVATPFVVATDARRKEVYLATYDENGDRMSGPFVERPEAAASSDPVVGEGAMLYPEAFPQPVGPVRPSAGWLGRAVVEERVELLDPEPLYLRRPDAEVPRAPKPVS